MSDLPVLTLTVYVPEHNSVERRLLANGCAIVGGYLGDVKATARIVVDLEDNRYGDRDRRPRYSWEAYLDCVKRAAGRHVERYPTVARAALPATELIDIGTYNPETGELDIYNPAELEAWADVDLFEGAPWRR